MRGLSQNQINSRVWLAQLVGDIILCISVNSGRDSPTHISATYAFSKIRGEFQNRIPRELDKNFGIPGISTIYWISSNFLKWQNRSWKKVLLISNPGIQPINILTFVKNEKILNLQMFWNSGKEGFRVCWINIVDFEFELVFSISVTGRR